MGGKWLHVSCDFLVSLTTLHDISEFTFNRTLKASHSMCHAVLVLRCVGKWENFVKWKSGQQVEEAKNAESK